MSKSVVDASSAAMGIAFQKPLFKAKVLDKKSDESKSVETFIK